MSRDVRLISYDRIFCQEQKENKEKILITPQSDAFHLQHVTLKGAWSGPAALQLLEHAMCDAARLLVREVVSASHSIADLTLGLGEVGFDYLKED